MCSNARKLSSPTSNDPTHASFRDASLCPTSLDPTKEQHEQAKTDLTQQSGATTV